MAQAEFSLTETLCGRIMDVVLRDGKVCLLSGDPFSVWAIPLICPVCGEPWHFISDDTEKLVKQIRKKIKGFSLIGISYIKQTSIERIQQTMQTVFQGTSDPYQEFIEEVPEHIGILNYFPVISLTLEKRRRGSDADDIMLIVHPTSILNSVEIIGWKEDEI